MSGSETISTSGVPARFRSTPVARGKRSCTDFPASSSMCTRWIRMARPAAIPGPPTATAPCVASGWSNWEIWYPFGRSG